MTLAEAVNHGTYMDNGPGLWASVLAAFEEPTAVVAGGCIRDYFLNLPPKDIDVFVSRDMDLSEVSIRLGMLWQLQEAAEYEAPEDERRLLALGTIRLHGHEINVIKMNFESPQKLIEDFDMGVVQAGFTRELGRFSTSLFWDDLALRRCTFTREHEVERSLRRYIRFCERHPLLLTMNNPFKKEIETGLE